MKAKDVQLGLLACVLLAPALSAQDATAFFEKKIRPVLLQHCTSCHGAEKQRGGLRLDSAAALRKGGDLGPAVVPGKPDDSRLIQAVRYKSDLKMPPKGKLSDVVVADLALWVKMGAPWPGATGTPAPVVAQGGEKEFSPEQRNFWAFKSPVAVRPPAVRAAAWPSNPLDHFILAALEAKGLQPAPPADRRTLIRRLSFDLTGLPPTPEEVAAFLDDQRPDALERLIDSLLASPAYGERWGRRWLDVARYADSNGMDENLAHANAWRYRDYVIGAFNRDQPYRDFVRDQLAGDLIDNDPERLVATGILSIGPKMLAEDDPVKMQMDIVDEQLDTVAQAFLGLTMGCARCHDHKFDPLTQADYYGLAGILKSTKTMNNFKVVAQWHERPLNGLDDGRAARFERDLAELQAKLMKRRQETRRTLLAEARRKADNYVAAAVELRRQPPLKSVMSDPKNAKEANILLVEAENFQRGNVRKDHDYFGPGIGVLVNAGTFPNFAEYDINVPAARTYQLEFRFAAAQSRPFDVSSNGRLALSAVGGDVTGGWYVASQGWRVAGALTLTAGKNVLRLERDQAFPHLDKLALVPVTGRRTFLQLTTEQGLSPRLLRECVGFLEKNDAASLRKSVLDERGLFAEIAPKEVENDVPDAVKSELVKFRAVIAQLEKQRATPPVAMAVAEGKVENLRVHLRGSHLTLGQEVQRRFPRILAGDKQPPLPNGQSGRRELAEWLTRDDHPLTARVMVNRLWLGHFGDGLVRTPDNFGALGERPTHPELLDWLAVEFVRSGWSIKAMHRLMLTSSTYRMSSQYDATAARLDPDNRLLWRFSRQRLDAESLRDAVLSVSGGLERTMYGSLLTVPNRQYVTGTANRNYDGYGQPRRSVYLPVIRSAVHDVFQAFDFADPSTLTGKRPTTTIAPQALFMMNGELMQKETMRLAEMLLSQPQLDDVGRLRLVFARAYGRQPSEIEMRRILYFVGRYQAAGATRAAAWQGVCRVVLSSNEFVYVE